MLTLLRQQAALHSRFVKIAIVSWLVCASAWGLSAVVNTPPGLLDLFLALGFATLVIACLRTHPRTRRGKWRYIVAAIWPLVCPLLLEPLGRLVYVIYPHLAPPQGRRVVVVSADIIVTGSLGLLALVSAFLLGVLTRSYRVGLIMAIATLPVLIWLESWNDATLLAVGIGWWTIAAITLVAWTLIGTRSFGPGRCSNCGYDLHGLESSTCPECGAAITSPSQVSAPLAFASDPQTTPPSPS